MDKNEVKKDLYKSKVNAKFSHYVSGNLYYTVELADGIYQFPIATIEIGKISVLYYFNSKKFLYCFCERCGFYKHTKIK